MSISLLLEMACDAGPDRTAVVADDVRLTTAELSALADGGAGVIAASGAQHVAYVGTGGALLPLLAVGAWWIVLAHESRELAERELVASLEKLRDAQRELAQTERLAAIGQLTATVSHELRNPLMALRAGLQLLEREADGANAGLIRERMATQVLHLSRLIEDLLDVSRIDQGKIALRLERVSLRAVLDSAIDTSRPKIDAGFHRLAVDLPEEPAWVAGDFTRLSQVVSNLLTNAAKYTPPRGEIRLSARLEPDIIEIAVEDNGVGVSPEMQERIFSLYTQVPGPDARSAEGLGIGLALVKQLIALHRGDIAVFSEGENQGSRFTVRLPRSV